MAYSYIWIVARDQSGTDVPGASIMEGGETLGRTGGSRPLPLDARVYFIHVEAAGLTSDVRRLALQPNAEQDAPTEVFVLQPTTAMQSGQGDRT